jgi:adenosylcobinamide-GDP ribazoletransferase
MWRAFLIAGRFLSRLPLPDPGPVSGRELARAAPLYPAVGLAIGLLVWGAARLLALPSVPDLAAALVLLGWVWLTGGLHLDGLADTADAWVGGLGDRRRTLEIMKDPTSGPFGVLALVLVLLCKWSAIAALMAGGTLASLIWIPVLARAQLLILFLTTPYVRPAGMGADIGAHLPRGAAWTGVVIAAIASPLFLDTATLPVLLAAGALLLLWRRSLMARLGGFSGDTAGALVELTETVVLATILLVPLAP